MYPPGTTPRDVILHIHFYHAKKELMQKARTLGTLSEPYEHLQLFMNLLQHMLQLHR